MTAPARFMFDTVFPGRHPEQADQMSIPKFSENELETARDAAYQDGLTAGRQEVADQASRAIDRKIEKLLSLTAGLQNELSAEAERISAQAADLAFTAARILARELIAREPDGEMLQLLDECVSFIKDAPHLVVRVPQGNLETLRQRIENITVAKGYEGKLVLLTEDGMTEGDCRIEWADGGVSRDLTELETSVYTLIAARFSRPGEVPELAPTDPGSVPVAPSQPEPAVEAEPALETETTPAPEPGLAPPQPNGETAMDTEAVKQPDAVDTGTDHDTERAPQPTLPTAPQGNDE